jgi:hypothetical protein
MTKKQKKIIYSKEPKFLEAIENWRLEKLIRRLNRENAEFAARLAKRLRQS